MVIMRCVILGATPPPTTPSPSLATPINCYTHCQPNLLHRCAQVSSGIVYVLLTFVVINHKLCIA